MGPKSVMVKVSFVPPRPSPATLASLELTFGEGVGQRRRERADHRDDDALGGGGTVAGAVVEGDDLRSLPVTFLTV